MLKTVVVVLGVVCIAGVVHGKGECKLPRPQIIGWHKLTGEWFNILNRNTPGDELLKCMQLRDFHKLKKGFSYVIEDYHLQSGTYEGVEVVFKEKRPGVYVIKHKNIKKWMQILKKDTSHFPQSVKKEAESLRTSEAVFYTDYKNYLIDFRCGKNGKKYIWIMSRNPHPKAKDILRITNKLAVTGNGWNSFPLYLSGCVKTQYDLTLFKS